MHIVRRIDAGYSPDVEIDETGRVVYARDIAAGEVITIPMHMFDRVIKAGRIG
jgi:hypothetical protein